MAQLKFSLFCAEELDMKHLLLFPLLSALVLVGCGGGSNGSSSNVIDPALVGTWNSNFGVTGECIDNAQISYRLETQANGHFTSTVTGIHQTTDKFGDTIIMNDSEGKWYLSGANMVTQVEGTTTLTSSCPYRVAGNQFVLTCPVLGASGVQTGTCTMTYTKQ